MEINTFVTETDSEFAKKQIYKSYPKIFLAFALIACLALLVTWQFSFFVK